MVWLFRIALVLALLVISWLAFTSNPPGASTLIWDKANHLIAFASLAFMADFSWPEKSRKQALIVWSLLLSYGLGIELVQDQLDHRYFEMNDVIADALGVMIYLLLSPLCNRLIILRQLKEKSHG